MQLRVRCLLCRQVIDYGPGETSVLLNHVREKHPNIKIVRLSDEVSATKLVLPKPSSKSLKTSPGADDKQLQYLRQHIKECQCNMDATPSSDTKLRKRSLNVEPHLAPLQMGASTESKPSFYRYLSAAKKSLSKRKVASDEVLYDRKTLPIDPLIPTRRHRRRYEMSVEKWRPGASKITCPKCGETKRPTIRRTATRASRNPFGAACLLTFWPLCFMPCMFPAPSQEQLHCADCGQLLGDYDPQSGTVMAPKEVLDGAAGKKESVVDELSNKKDELNTADDPLHLDKPKPTI